MPLASRNAWKVVVLQLTIYAATGAMSARDTKEKGFMIRGILNNSKLRLSAWHEKDSYGFIRKFA